MSELDGHTERTYNGTPIPYSYYGDKLNDYFNTGFSQFHSLSVGTASENSHFRTSLGFNDNNGLFQNETLDKLTVDINAGATLSKYLSLDGKVSLSRMKAENRPLTGLNGEVAQLLLIPGNIRLEDLATYSTSERAHVNWFGPNQQYSNPYYVRHRYQNSDERWRAFGYYAARVNFTDWLKFSAKYAFDGYRTRIQASDLSLADQAISDKVSSWQQKITTDEMNRTEEFHFEQNIEFMLMGDNRLNDDFRLVYSLGSNIMYQNYEMLSVGVNNLLEKDNWILNTGERINSASNDGHKRAMYSAFGSLQLSFREYLSLDLTARNDWSSTLPARHYSFFYPSASLSFVATDFFRSIDKSLPEWMTFAKVRTSFAQVGKDPDPYNLYNTRTYRYINGVRVPVSNTIKMNDNLKPETKTSYEVGLDMKFLDNRLGFDFTYYHTGTKNQSMLVAASSPW
ncbi:MAG: TonB-dependent receptor domain-containing protein [Coprobacter sp.]